MQSMLVKKSVRMKASQATKAFRGEWVRQYSESTL